MAPLALVHRRAASDSGTLLDWSAEDDQQVAKLIGYRTRVRLACQQWP